MKLPAQKRAPGKAKALRAQGRLPGVVYNREYNQPVSLELRTFDKVFRHEGASSLIDLDIDGDIHQVLIKSVQMDKRHRVPMHVDFFAITAGEVVEVAVPLEFTGTALGVREGGLLDVQRREVHISILPRLIPSHLDIDISALQIGDSVHVGDIASLFPPEAEILDDEDVTLIAVVPPRVEEEVEEAAAVEGEPEVIGKGAEEGEEEEAKEVEE